MRQRLERWWSAVCRAAGASACTIDRQHVSTTPPGATNEVPLVPLPVPRRTHRRLDLPGLFFALDSAELDRSADADLSRVAAVAAAGRCPVTVTGRTDAVTGTPGHNLLLSSRRAAAVADRLLILGLPRPCLGAVRGVGQAGADAVRERADPRVAQADRTVAIAFPAP